MKKTIPNGIPMTLSKVLISSAADAVKTINAQRKKVYEERAAAQGVPAGQVGRVYAGEIFKKAPAGTLFVQEDGEVKKK